VDDVADRDSSCRPITMNQETPVIIDANRRTLEGTIRGFDPHVASDRR
jgi:small nuclear ribonucleoprotein (snRNP)-like protein